MFFSAFGFEKGGKMAIRNRCNVKWEEMDLSRGIFFQWAAVRVSRKPYESPNLQDFSHTLLTFNLEEIGESRVTLCIRDLDNQEGPDCYFRRKKSGGSKSRIGRTKQRDTHWLGVSVSVGISGKS